MMNDDDRAYEMRAFLLFMTMQENHAISHKCDDIVYDSYCRVFMGKFIKTCNDCEGIYINVCEFCIEHNHHAYSKFNEREMNQLMEEFGNVDFFFDMEELYHETNQICISCKNHSKFTNCY